MNEKIFVLPYRKGSKSVANLVSELEGRGIKFENSKYRHKAGNFVINWGNSNSTIDFTGPGTVLNRPEAVGFVTNKLNFFRVCSDFNIEEDKRPRIPDWTQSFDEVESWLNENNTVFVRTKLTGHSGEGIEVLTNDNRDLSKYRNNQTLFTKYVKKKDEYRVHIFQGDVVDVQRKAKRNDVNDANFMIRSHDNGFIYSRNNVGDVPKDVYDQSLKAFNCLDIDFGAVDVIYNRLHKQAFVLEINTAPGLEGTTLQNYVNRFKQHYEDVVKG